MKKSLFFTLFLPFFVFSHTHSLLLVKTEGDTLLERISPPPEFTRLEAKEKSFGEYLRNYPLKDSGSPLLLHNKNPKNDQDSHAAIFALPIETDFEKTVQSIIHLYADYLLKIGEEEKISFHLTNGEISKWTDWYKNSKSKRNERTEIAGNLKKWTKFENPPKKSEIYKKYLKNLFAHTNLLSIMEYESEPTSLYEAAIGDIIFDLGNPGHICLVVDVAANQKTGEKAFLLAEGSDVAQEFHIIKNPKRVNDPWYHEDDFLVPLETPEYTFPKGSFRHLRYLDEF